MTIAMSELADAEPCDVLRGVEGPVYFLFSGRLYVVHEVLGRWIESVSEPPAEARFASSEEGGASRPVPAPRNGGNGENGKDARGAASERAQRDGQGGPGETRSEDPGRPQSGRGEAKSDDAGRPRSGRGETKPEDGSYPRSGRGEIRTSDVGRPPLRRRSGVPEPGPDEVEHWLVVASVGRFGTPGVFRLQRRPAPTASGPDTWSARAERR
jgi:hypothetical protein